MLPVPVVHRGVGDRDKGLGFIHVIGEAHAGVDAQIPHDLELPGKNMDFHSVAAFIHARLLRLFASNHFIDGPDQLPGPNRL